MFKMFPHISEKIKINPCQRPICGSCNNRQVGYPSFIMVVLYYTSSHESFLKPLANITRVMQKIGFNTSPDNIIITPEKVVATIEHMAHYIPTIC